MGAKETFEQCKKYYWNNIQTKPYLLLSVANIVLHRYCEWHDITFRNSLSICFDSVCGEKDELLYKRLCLWRAASWSLCNNNSLIKEKVSTFNYSLQVIKFTNCRELVAAKTRCTKTNKKTKKQETLILNSRVEETNMQNSNF